MSSRVCGRLLPIAAVALCLANPVFAVALEGTLEIDGPLDTSGSPVSGVERAYVSITGAAAARLYGALKIGEQHDACSGQSVKSVGNVSCYEIDPGKTYVCGYGIDLASGAVVAGAVGGC